ncbi:MAG: hypothetical protein HYT72_04125 [Candidatus Aenigmarchaeota archaeon]|nr:hypothetical protein [Candidatus Aenigmarchaeota archaeon]
MGFLDAIRFLLSPRRKIYRLRKKYDRLREKADKIRQQEKRVSVLSILDQLESTLVILEEQNVSRFEQHRMVGYVKSGLAKAKTIMKQPAQQDFQYQKRRLR